VAGISEKVKHGVKIALTTFAKNGIRKFLNLTKSNNDK